MKNLMDILDFGWKGSTWRLREPHTYAELEWLDLNTIKPTLAQIQAKSDEMDLLDYREARRAEYPPIGDQLDALWKGGQAQTDMLAQIQTIKARYPKP